MDPLTRSISNGSTDTTDTTRTNANKGPQTYNKDVNRKQNNATANNSLKLEVPLPSPKIVEVKNTFDPNFDLKNGSNSYENNTKSVLNNQSKNEALNGQESGSNNNITNDRSKSQATTESLLKNPFGIDLELDDNTISQIII
ncbi:unnamed protein product [[Candida] boidinii]|uniref:Unnamed protein product n=1 Tax=Candida boidinii TaxID=5477 RepID=A0A9W6T701_CANBO|nr:unnamed protein product [[Candida] boidinii]